MESKLKGVLIRGNTGKLHLYIPVFIFPCVSYFLLRSALPRLVLVGPWFVSAELFSCFHFVYFSLSRFASGMSSLLCFRRLVFPSLPLVWYFFSLPGFTFTGKVLRLTFSVFI